MGRIVEFDSKDVGDVTDEFYVIAYADQVYLPSVSRERFDQIDAPEHRITETRSRPANRTHEQRQVMAYEKQVGALCVWTKRAPAHVGGHRNPLARPPTPGGAP